MEWHPFTASSSPQDDHLSFHIRVVGDWTGKFSKCLGCDFGNNNLGTTPRMKILPPIKIDGFYGAPAEDVFQYDISILIGAGIGVTPFASILKDIWNRHRHGDKKLHIPKKVYFMWICKETHAFEWFQSLLVRLEEDGVGEVVEILIYLTQQLNVNQIRSISLNRNLKRDVITGLESRTHFGRPKLEDFFKRVSKSHPGSDIGVFCCGPPALSDQVGRYCSKYTHSVTNGIRFHYGKENF